MLPVVRVSMQELVIAGLLAVSALVAGCSRGEPRVGDRLKGRTRIGVLGDSDSHSYHDSILLPPQQQQRGGEYRDTTFQWTEIWARLRPNEVDFGDWGTWGTRGTVAEVLSRIGFEGRAPRKQDYRYNMAFPGARCDHLMDTKARQAPRLVYLMNQEPERWANGIVIVRIGINSVGTTADLDAYAASGLTASAREKVNSCVRYLEEAVTLIRKAHPTTRIVVVGIFDDADSAMNLGRWRSPEARHNITSVLDLFDSSVRAIAGRDSYTVFADDRKWFRDDWGSRSSAGLPAYQGLALGGAIPVTNSVGDHPRNMTLEDGHAGTVQNGLWLIDMVALLNERWQFGFTPITAGEITHVADPNGAYGLSTVR
jgi:hypothetical protein